MSAETEVDSAKRRRDSIVLVAVWLLFAVGAMAMARQNLSIPGVYYDEAVFAGLAKDFVVGQPRLHMPGCERPDLFGRPFPLFVQPYLGALKCWMLIPAFALFGSTIAVERLTILFWALLALLFLMLGIKRWLGLRAALIAGLVLLMDPTYFFLGVLDWGAAISALFCRCLAFYLALVWWRNQRPFCLFLAALFLGLGVFNKVDFLALIAGIGISAVCFFPRPLWLVLRARPSLAAIAGAGFLLGLGPMILKIPRIVTFTVSGQAAVGSGGLAEKFHTFIALYDGSYFYRLMANGGLFNKIYDQPAGVHTLLWLVLLMAMVALGVTGIFSHNKDERRIAGFLLVAFALTTLCVFLLPGAVRIHHAFLAFPFPQLIIAAALTFLWKRETTTFIRRGTDLATAGLMILLLVSQLRAITKTENLLAETGGRGWWSDTFNTFCRENENRADLILCSLDWGFNEQLAFLTDKPRLVEPFWAFPSYQGALPALPAQPEYLFLAHSNEYSLLHYDTIYLEALQREGDNVEIQPHTDRQGRVVFYTIRFPAQ